MENKKQQKGNKISCSKERKNWCGRLYNIISTPVINYRLPAKLNRYCNEKISKRMSFAVDAKAAVPPAEQFGSKKIFAHCQLLLHRLMQTLVIKIIKKGLFAV